MSRRDDLDDWFADPAEQAPSAEQPDEDDWLQPAVPEPRPRRRTFADDLARRRVVLAGGGAAAVALLLLVLWVVGAFGGGGGSSAPTTSTAPQTRPTTTAPTATRPPAAIAPTQTLQPGASGEQVKRLQRALRKLGFLTGAIDGSYGPATVAAVKRFQQAAGLTADGVVGPATLRALRERLASTG